MLLPFCTYLSRIYITAGLQPSFFHLLSALSRPSATTKKGKTKSKEKISSIWLVAAVGLDRAENGEKTKLVINRLLYIYM